MNNHHELLEKTGKRRVDEVGHASSSAWSQEFKMEKASFFSSQATTAVTLIWKEWDGIGDRKQ